MCKCDSAHLHPQGDVVHLEGGVSVVQVHLQPGSLAGNGGKDTGIVRGGAHVEGVVAATASFGQLETRHKHRVWIVPLFSFRCAPTVISQRKKRRNLLEERQRVGIRDSWRGVGHGAHHGDSARQRRRGPGREVLLVRGSGLP